MKQERISTATEDHAHVLVYGDRIGDGTTVELTFRPDLPMTVGKLRMLLANPEFHDDDPIWIGDMNPDGDHKYYEVVDFDAGWIWNTLDDDSERPVDADYAPLALIMGSCVSE